MRPRGRGRARRAALRFALVAAGSWAAATSTAKGESALPPAPSTHVFDAAGALSQGAASAIDGRLAAFEREQGTQIVVALFRRLPEGEALEDWTTRVAQSWRIGRAKQDDGAVLFAFVDDRRLRLEVGYGLEGALTDLESKAILDEVLVPRLAAGDWDGGVSSAADAIVAAVRGEYKPDPNAARRAVGAARRPGGREVLFVIFLVVVVVRLLSRASRRGNWRSGGFGGGGFGGFGGGGFSGGGFGGGGFSGGGGGFGGGGASGRW